ncbi:MAG: hypothetical protein FWC47_01790 [Oscillospiraceae bacterium]|nr:hypothetical protein [Oscillospiraceae bacterium]
MVECYVRDKEVADSNPVTSAILNLYQLFLCIRRIYHENEFKGASLVFLVKFFFYSNLHRNIMVKYFIKRSIDEKPI